MAEIGTLEHIITVNVSDIIAIVRENEKLHHGIGDLFLYLREKKAGRDHLSLSCGDPTIKIIRKYIAELIAENEALKEQFNKPTTE